MGKNRSKMAVFGVKYEKIEIPQIGEFWSPFLRGQKMVKVWEKLCKKFIQNGFSYKIHTAKNRVNTRFLRYLYEV